MIAVKDFFWEKTATGWRIRNCPMGEGMVNWKAYLRACWRRPTSTGPSRCTSNTRCRARRPRPSGAEHARRGRARPGVRQGADSRRRTGDSLAGASSWPPWPPARSRSRHRAPPTSGSTKSATATRTTSIARPYKFGGRVVDRVTLLNVRCRVTTSNGKTRLGLRLDDDGEHVGVPVEDDVVRHDARRDEGAGRAHRAHHRGLPGGRPPARSGARPRAGVSEGGAGGVGGARSSTSRSRSCARCSSPVRSTPRMHDAFGKVHGRNVYATYGPDLLPNDLSRYLGAGVPRRAARSRAAAEGRRRASRCFTASAASIRSSEGRREAARRRAAGNAAGMDRVQRPRPDQDQVERRRSRVGRRSARWRSIASPPRRRRGAA